MACLRFWDAWFLPETREEGIGLAMTKTWYEERVWEVEARDVRWQ